MLPLLGAALGVGSLAAGLIGNKKTNEANARLSAEQMAFQERMSNTAHQREVHDLRAAGLNPILSATGGSGASSPAGSSATMQAPDYSSAKSIASDALAMKQMSTQMSNTVADTASKIEQAKLLGTQNESAAKDVEKKGIQNSFEYALLDQQLKKGGLDNEFTAKSLGDRLKQLQLDNMSTSTGTAQKAQALKYDYMTDKLLENANMLPSNAGKPGSDDAGSMMGLVIRRLFGK